jgi:hypothetical protein
MVRDFVLHRERTAELATGDDLVACLTVLRWLLEDCLVRPTDRKLDLSQRLTEGLSSASPHIEARAGRPEAKYGTPEGTSMYDEAMTGWDA